MQKLAPESVLNLMAMDKLLFEIGHRLILRSVAEHLRKIFRQLGLEAMFCFTADRTIALDALSHIP